MRLNRDKLNSIKNDTVIDITVSNRPGLYFLFDQEYKLIYIGESLFPLSRILDHYWKAYLNKKGKKGIGPIFSYFRIINLDNETRIRQHYEKRYIKHYNPEHNHGANRAPYSLTCKQIKAHIMIYEMFFKNMSWYRYINDEVLKKMSDGLAHKKKLRKLRNEKNIIKN